MATQTQYAAGAAAAFAVLKAEVTAEVPVFFRDEISDEMLQTLAEKSAKASIDAALEVPTQGAQT